MWVFGDAGGRCPWDVLRPRPMLLPVLVCFSCRNTSTEQRPLLVPVTGGWKAKIKVSVGFLPSEASVLGM